MKKYSILVLILILVLSLCACMRRNDTTPTNSTTLPQASTSYTTEPTILPTMPATNPTLDTNIPDPTVDSNSGNGIFDETDPTHNTVNQGGITE